MTGKPYRTIEKADGAWKGRQHEVYQCELVKNRSPQLLSGGHRRLSGRIIVSPTRRQDGLRCPPVATSLYPHQSQHDRE